MKAVTNKLASFKELSKTIAKQTRTLTDHIRLDVDKLKDLWCNINHYKDYNLPHEHFDAYNKLSGVYYVESQKGASPIQIFDPRPIAHHLKPVNRPNWENAGMIQFDAEQGTGIIFPSWLQHWVPPTQADRVSVSWNIIPRGSYGSISEYQYAHI